MWISLVCSSQELDHAVTRSGVSALVEHLDPLLHELCTPQAGECQLLVVFIQELNEVLSGLAFRREHEVNEVARERFANTHRKLITNVQDLVEHVCSDVVRVYFHAPRQQRRLEVPSSLTNVISQLGVRYVTQGGVHPAITRAQPIR